MTHEGMVHKDDIGFLDGHQNSGSGTSSTQDSEETEVQNNADSVNSTIGVDTSYSDAGSSGDSDPVVTDIVINGEQLGDTGTESSDTTKDITSSDGNDKTTSQETDAQEIEVSDRNRSISHTIESRRNAMNDLDDTVTDSSREGTPGDIFENQSDSALNYAGATITGPQDASEKEDEQVEDDIQAAHRTVWNWIKGGADDPSADNEENNDTEAGNDPNTGSSDTPEGVQNADSWLSQEHGMTPPSGTGDDTLIGEVRRGLTGYDADEYLSRERGMTPGSDVGNETAPMNRDGRVPGLEGSHDTDPDEETVLSGDRVDERGNVYKSREAVDNEDNYTHPFDPRLIAGGSGFAVTLLMVM